jgi:2-dehydropantoate 2-reductase
VKASPRFDSAVVLGAGAVGSFLGARLSAVVPTFLVARAAHATSISERGMRLTGAVDETARVEAGESPPEIGARALAVVTVKTRGLAWAAGVLARRSAPGVRCLCVQNGLDPDARLREELARLGRQDLRVSRALTTAGCNLVGPGEVEYWGGGLAFDASDDPAPLVAIFEKAGVPAGIERDFARAVWMKLAVNCVANPLTAILGCRNREVVTAELAPLRGAIVEEVRRAARGSGVELPEDACRLVDEALAESANRSSMLQDIAYGRPTEIGELCERVSAIVEASGVGAPANRTVARLVRFLEARRVAG